MACSTAAFGRPNAYYDGYPGNFYDPTGRYYGYGQYGTLSPYYGYLDYPNSGGLGYPYMAQPAYLRRLRWLCRWLWRLRWLSLRRHGYGGYNPYFGYGGYGGYGGLGLAGGGGFGFGYPFGGLGFGVGFGGLGYGLGYGGFGYGLGLGFGLGFGGFGYPFFGGFGFPFYGGFGFGYPAFFGGFGYVVGNINRGRFPFNPGRNMNHMPGQNMNHMPVNRGAAAAARTTRLVSNSAGNRPSSVVHQGAGARGGAGGLGGNHQGVHPPPHRRPLPTRSTTRRRPITERQEEQPLTRVGAGMPAITASITRWPQRTPPPGRRSRTAECSSTVGCRVGGSHALSGHGRSTRHWCQRLARAG